MSVPGAPEPVGRHHSLRIPALLVLVVAGVAVWFFWTRTMPEPTEPVPFTSYPGREWSPSFSPDGNQVAFEWEVPGKENSHIYVKLIGTSEPQRLTKNPAEERSPHWSPDGRQIAFVRKLSPTRNAVFLIPAIGGPERKLTEDRRVFSMAWHPGGEWLVLAERNSESEPLALYLFSVATGERRQLTRPPQKWFGDVAPAVSPDGHSLVFTRISPVSSPTGSRSASLWGIALPAIRRGRRMENSSSLPGVPSTIRACGG
jgi:Tol biopolymer transport system component